MNIVLCGMMGVGKSVVGAALARRAGARWVDTDQMITEKCGEIATIFEQFGEEYFRDLEVETVKALSGTVDIYLPDLKYYKSSTAASYSHAPSLPEVSRAAIAQMVLSTGAPVLDSSGIMRRGTIVRILLLPGHLAEAKLNVRYLYDTYGNDIYISLMSQYTPMPKMPPPLDRRVTASEYRELCAYAERIGVTNAFVQDAASASVAYIPPFDT